MFAESLMIILCWIFADHDLIYFVSLFTPKRRLFSCYAHWFSVYFVMLLFMHFLFFDCEQFM